MRYLLSAAIVVLIAALPAKADYLGSWKIDDVVCWTVNTHDPTTGGAVDADAAPTYRIYEDETGTPILTGTMALLDASNTNGQYSECVTASAANGFEKGKNYNIRVAATVGSVTGAKDKNFQIEAEVDSNTNSGGVDLAKVGGSNITSNSGRLEVIVQDGTGAGQIDTSSGRVQLTQAQLDLITAAISGAFSIHSGTAQGGASMSITLDAGASGTSRLYEGLNILIQSGAGSGQVRIVNAYNGTSKVAGVNRPWIVNPDNTSAFVIYAP